MGRKAQGIASSTNRWQLIPRTLCFVTYHNDVLLLKGAPDKRIWPGKYNGVGGHVERHEDILQAARREIKEETGLDVSSLHLRGIVHIDTGQQQTGIGLFVFTAQAYQRATTPSSEGHLEWHPIDNLPPQDDMVEDLPILLPRTLSMNISSPPFFARYWYDTNDHLHIDFAGE